MSLDNSGRTVNNLIVSAEEYDDILSGAGMGLWRIVFKEGQKPHMQVNRKAAELLGIDGSMMSVEEIYVAVYDRIVPDALLSVRTSVREMIDGNFAENTCVWRHPSRGIIYVRFSGNGRMLINGASLLSGYLNDVTETVLKDRRKKKELEDAEASIAAAYGMIRGFSHEYHTIWLVDKKTLQMDMIHSTGKDTARGALRIGIENPDFDTAFDKYIDAYVDPTDRKRMHREIRSSVVLKNLEKTEFYSLNYLRRDDKGNVAYHQVAFSNADTEDGKQQFVYGFKDVDAEVKEEIAEKEELKRARAQAEERSTELLRQLDIINSLAEVYNAIYYVDMKARTYIQIGVNSEHIRNEISMEGRVSDAFNIMYQLWVHPKDQEAVRMFTDLDTLDERLKDRGWLAHEFCGPDGRWTEGIFIAAGRNEEGKCNHVIWATRDIDEIKRKEERLTYTSITDEMTGLLNRRSYERELDIYRSSGIPRNFTYISIDVNGLKNINDNIGHEAGDELITGAAGCMKRALGPYGNVYRTGGDEFIALLSADKEKAVLLQHQLEEEAAAWHGKLVDSLSMASGVVAGKETETMTLEEIITLADKRMYETKFAYYRRKGVDRRGQRDAHAALCALYCKILKVNLTQDTFEAVNLDPDEQEPGRGYSESFSEWIRSFGESGQVYPDDLDDYMKKSDPDRMKEYFRNGGKSLHFSYRRKFGDSFKEAMLEVIPANDYKDDSQSLYIYVRSLER